MFDFLLVIISLFICVFVGLVHNTLLRSFTTAAESNTTDIDNDIENEFETNYNLHEMTGKQVLKSLEISKNSKKKLKKMMKFIMPLAKEGEIRFENIKTTLKDKCEFSEADAGLMSKWFVTKFKETTETAPKGMCK